MVTERLAPSIAYVRDALSAGTARRGGDVYFGGVVGGFYELPAVAVALEVAYDVEGLLHVAGVAVGGYGAVGEDNLALARRR